MNAGEGTTVIGKSVKIVGDLAGSEDLQLDGELQGTVQLLGSRLTLGASARVRGNVLAQDVVIVGHLEGDIRAKGRVDLRAGCVVLGNIYAGSFSIEDNASFRGQIDPTRAGESLPERSGTAVARSTPPAAVAGTTKPLVDQGGTRPAAPLFPKTQA